MICFLILELENLKEVEETDQRLGISPASSLGKQISKISKTWIINRIEKEKYLNTMGLELVCFLFIPIIKYKIKVKMVPELFRMPIEQITQPAVV
jgi:hypothetical protein